MLIAVLAGFLATVRAVILRPWSAVRLAVLALACALLPASAGASLTGLGEVRDSIPELATALPRELPGPCAGALCDELERVQPKTRVRGFALDLHCRLGGEQGLSCAPRRVYGVEYGERASDQSLFTGHYFDTETQLYYAKARYFDPELGRFLSQDSYLGELTEPPSLHRYLYAWDRPTYWADATGHAPGDLWDPRSYDWGVFASEFGKGAANVVTLGGSGRLREAYDSGRLNAKSSSFDVLSEYSAGVINGVTLGGADRFVEARVNEDRSVVDSAAQAVKRTGAGLVGVDEIGTLRDPNADGWDKATAASGLVAKWAGIAAAGAGGLKNARATRTAEAPGFANITPEAADLADLAHQVGGLGEAAAPTQAAVPIPIASNITPQSGAGYIGPERQLPAPATARLPQDVAVNPNAPRALPLSRRIGSSPAQDAELRRDIAAAQAAGATGIRVNQQQLDAAGNRVGTGRPDLSFVRPDKVRKHIEYDTPSSGRGVPHADRLLANDPNCVVECKTIK